MTSSILELRVPFAALFEDGSQLVKIPLLTTLHVRPNDVRIVVTTTDGEFVVVHSDGPVMMQLSLLSGANLTVSDGHREIHVQFPVWKFRRVANAIRTAGVAVDATGIFGTPR